jgi:hypothetical protein
MLKHESKLKKDISDKEKPNGGNCIMQNLHLLTINNQL